MAALFFAIVFGMSAPTISADAINLTTLIQARACTRPVLFSSLARHRVATCAGGQRADVDLPVPGRLLHLSPSRVRHHRHCERRYQLCQVTAEAGTARPHADVVVPVAQLLVERVLHFAGERVRSASAIEQTCLRGLCGGGGWLAQQDMPVYWSPGFYVNATFFAFMAAVKLFFAGNTTASCADDESAYACLLRFVDAYVGSAQAVLDAYGVHDINAMASAALLLLMQVRHRRRGTHSVP